MGKSTSSMAIFNSYVSSPEGSLMVLSLWKTSPSSRWASCHQLAKLPIWVRAVGPRTWSGMLVEWIIPWKDTGFHCKIAGIAGIRGCSSTVHPSKVWHFGLWNVVNLLDMFWFIAKSENHQTVLTQNGGGLESSLQPSGHWCRAGGMLRTSCGSWLISSCPHAH